MKNIVKFQLLIMIVFSVITYQCQKATEFIGKEIKIERKLSTQKYIPLEDESPFANILSIDKIEGNTIYYNFNLDSAKKEFKADKIYLITTFDSRPKELTTNSFKVNLHEGFSFITGSGFENMFFSWNNGNKANNKNIYHLNFNNNSNTYKVYLEDGKVIL